MSDVEKVPMMSNGKLKPTPNAKSRIKPRNLLPKLVTILRSKIRPGERQGEAIVPLAAPNINADNQEPPLVVLWLVIKRGVYIS